MQWLHLQGGRGGDWGTLVYRMPGDLGHLSQTCPRTHGGKVRRHDHIVSMWQLGWGEKCIGWNMRCRYPLEVPIVSQMLWIKRMKMCHVLNIQVAADRLLSMAQNTKCQKYSVTELQLQLLELTGTCDIIGLYSSPELESPLSTRECWCSLGNGLDGWADGICSLWTFTWTHCRCGMWSSSMEI